MWWQKYKVRTSLVATALLVAAGCGGETVDDETDGTEAVEDPTLVSADVLFDGAPSNEELPSEDKADQVFPPKFAELVELQSPVQSQGSRGVCSIFSTVAYMEHLYISEGTITNPDFSEQYLQWSAKFEVGSFPHSSGSNAASNLRAISDYGIPEEAAWPYEPNQWGAAEDPECGGEDNDDLPTRCYTNGEPPPEAREAEKFFLPAGRYISTRPRSIKAQMFNKKQAVVVGLTFFYQSWNHRRSQLPRNMEYWNQGYVLYPNQKDREISLEKRAGHSILLVGWDDELEVPIMDENGEQVLDENGEPITERGFFIFKNSWGTGSFGKDNPHGDGYGFISYRYVEEYGSGRISDLPELDRPQELCGDGVDNDGNFATDCDDAACAEEAICNSSAQIIEIPLPEGGLDIPDNDAGGIQVPFDVTDEGTLQALNLTVDVTHSFRGDVSIRLVHPDGTEVTVQPNGHDAGDDIQKTYVVEGLEGKPAPGGWTLIVADHARIDTGTLNSASLELVR